MVNVEPWSPEKDQRYQRLSRSPDPPGPNPGTAGAAGAGASPKFPPEPFWKDYSVNDPFDNYQPVPVPHAGALMAVMAGLVVLAVFALGMLAGALWF